jgi:tRNA (guanosine-2'-O-)-methyltransferase
MELISYLPPMENQLIDYLEQFITTRRSNLFHKIIENRTRYITVVLEDIFQPHNASAVLRTCDCFGIQDVHIIENNNKYSVNPDIALGANKWLSLHKYNSSENNTRFALQSLKEKGYRIVATTPHKNDIDLENFDLAKGKTALVFGTELKGLSEEVIEMSDEYLKIPMFGFTESFNISVSVAIILHHLTYNLRSTNLEWELQAEEKSEILIGWLKNTIKNPEPIIKKFIKQQVGDR